MTQESSHSAALFSAHFNKASIISNHAIGWKWQIFSLFGTPGDPAATRFLKKQASAPKNGC